jgi:hypothetical protein
MPAQRSAAQRTHLKSEAQPVRCIGQYLREFWVHVPKLRARVSGAAKACSHTRVLAAQSDKAHVPPRRMAQRRALPSTAP